MLTLWAGFAPLHAQTSSRLSSVFLSRGEQGTLEVAVSGGQPTHAVTDDQRALLAARMAQHAAAVGRFDHHVAAVRCHNQPEVEVGACGVASQSSNASSRAAQMKSLIEMPPTEWVFNRTVQRL